MVASMGPVPAAARGASAPTYGENAESEEVTAGVYLQRAFHHFRQDRNRAAAEEFEKAILTGNLNDAGRALAYWHIFVSERSLGRESHSNDALASFVVVAEDVLDTQKNSPYAEEMSADFVERFDLKRRLARARATLSAAWTERAPHYGRTTSNPVRIHDRDELRYFLEMAKACNATHNPRMRPQASQEESVENYIISCQQAGAKAEHYYIELLEPLGPDDLFATPHRR